MSLTYICGAIALIISLIILITIHIIGECENKHSKQAKKERYLKRKSKLKEYERSNNE